ncbi:Hypothetical protein OINT_1001226 [Brucella intermedia LMG 3301]|uniref:Uncharacterized protein n=1 Tax=Brucella intermedia LMG 3301 TaxID=641118 RepID=C4WJL6_9HYPH|nr:Hypothetical protein OINT_1001226 [Brucella intermedia LMG 3301]
MEVKLFGERELVSFKAANFGFREFRLAIRETRVY